jgi:glutamate-1-semialdehyde 2,1-aminomutase
MTADLAIIDRDRLAALIDRERAAYRANFPRSREAFAETGNHLLGGVPMTWMRMWSGGFPLFHATASGARLTDIDGHEFIDFCPNWAGPPPCCPHPTRRGSRPN